MRDKVFALLGVEPGEESLVSILLTQSVFLGIFFGAFDISAHSLFLSVFDEKMMAKAYVVSGLAGIILTSLYTFLQTRLSFKNFATANLFAVTLLTLLLWTGLLVTTSEWIVFTVFIMLGPLNILAALGFWGTAGRLFTLRQGKRLFGLVDSGLIAGIIISCYTIPVVLSFNFKSHNILLISAFAVFAATILQAVIGSRFNLAREKAENKKPAEKKSVWSVLGKNRYITVMSVFVALSVMTAFFVQYSFMAVARQQYPSEEDLARFLGIFTGSMMIFTLLVKLLAFSYLIRSYGLRIAMTISPILIAAMAAIAILIGSAMGYTPAAASGFMIFFLIMALSRLFSKSLKDSVESPSFKVIYQTLDEKIRFEVQSAMDGTVNEIAALTSGLILAGLGMLSFVRLIHFSAVLFIITLAWIFVAFLLYSEYRKSIRKALETRDDTESKPVVPGGIKLRNRLAAGISLRQDYYGLITGENVPPGNNQSRWYFENLIRQTAETNDINLIPALRKISADSGIDTETRRKSEETIKEVERYNHGQDARRTVHAHKILSGSRVPQTTEILRFLRDSSIESKRYALYMIGKFRLTDMLTEVCNCLGNPSLEADAESVLVSFGQQAVADLQRYNMTISGNTYSSTAVLRILSKIPCPESSSFLFSRLWSPSRRIKEVAVRGLLDINYVPEGDDRDRLHQLISDTMVPMTWNLAARVCLQKNNDTFLIKILDKDIIRCRQHLFNLLSLAYDRNSVEKIRENLEKDTVESGNFALEMIDIVIDESIKPKIIALLDLVLDEDKLKNLWHFFPGDLPTYDKLTENIINRDYNLISIWTKVSTLRRITEISEKNIAESVSALMFSPERIVREESARLLARTDMTIYRSVSGRIADAVKKKLDIIAEGKNDAKDLLYEKTLFLSGFFSSIPEDELLILSEKMVYIKDFQTGTTCAPECIVWNLEDEGRSAYINYNGDAGNSLPAGTYYLLPFSAVDEYSRLYPESTKELLMYIDSNELQN